MFSFPPRLAATNENASLPIDISLERHCAARCGGNARPAISSPGDNTNRILAANERNTIPPGFRFKLSDVESQQASEWMMFDYWLHWGNPCQKKTGRPVTYEVLARIHNGGPLGWKKPETIVYWHKVKAIMEGGAK